MERYYYIYMLSNLWRTTLYIGVTNDIARRVWEHREGIADGFSKKYKLKHLVYFEQFATAMDAIEREKQLKRWSRAKKNVLVNALNPSWRDLYLDFTG